VEYKRNTKTENANFATVRYAILQMILSLYFPFFCRWLGGFLLLPEAPIGLAYPLTSYVPEFRRCQFSGDGHSRARHALVAIIARITPALV